MKGFMDSDKHRVALVLSVFLAVLIFTRDSDAYFITSVSLRSEAWTNSTGYAVFNYEKTVCFY
jgi:hypothetical protein